ncbi:MAG: potassium channel protein - like protein [Prosthecobacter sp.]
MSLPSPAATVPQGGHFRHAAMLAVALAFLVLVGLVLPHGDSGESFREWLLAHAWFRPVLFSLWAVVVLEGLLGLFQGANARIVRVRRLVLTALLPPLRMITASSTPCGWLWLPGAGWRPTGEATTEKLEQKLALPMVILTLLVLPVLGAELTGGETLENHPRMALATHFITCLIWVGFTVEFLWMVAAAPDKPAYCLKNWINLIIILLPLFAFLRALNMFRFARMVRAGKLLRAYRLRGLWTRLWKLALLFNLFERLQQRDPAKYRAVLEKKIAGLEKELTSLRTKLDSARQETSPPSSTPT